MRQDTPQVRSDLRILFYDIETAPVKAYLWNKYTVVAGQDLDPDQQQSILTIAYKFNTDKEAKCLAVNSEAIRKDRHILEEFAKVLEKADFAVGHYANKFDWPKLMWRFAYNGLPCPNKPKHLDTYRLQKSTFLNDWSNSLDHIAKMLGFEGKTKVSWEIWAKIMDGTKEERIQALEVLKQYNKNDVVILENIFNKLLPYYNTVLPIGKSVSACPHCGSESFSKVGVRKTIKSVTQRYKCNKCHHSFSGESISHKKHEEEQEIPYSRNQDLDSVKCPYCGGNHLHKKGVDSCTSHLRHRFFCVGCSRQFGVNTDKNSKVKLNISNAKTPKRSLENKTIRELKQLASQAQIKNYGNMTKDTLIKELSK